MKEHNEEELGSGAGGKAKVTVRVSRGVAQGGQAVVDKIHEAVPQWEVLEEKGLD